MNQLVYAAPSVALICGVALIVKALGLVNDCRFSAANGRWRLAVVMLLAAAVPSVVYAQADLRSAVESGNAIIMYLCGVFAAIGIVTAGVSMMVGRPTIAKWAFAGAMVSGLGFAIVKTMWDSFGLTSADVGTF